MASSTSPLPCECEEMGKEKVPDSCDRVPVV